MLTSIQLIEAIQLYKKNRDDLIRKFNLTLTKLSKEDRDSLVDKIDECSLEIERYSAKIGEHKFNEEAAIRMQINGEILRINDTLDERDRLSATITTKLSKKSVFKI